MASHTSTLSCGKGSTQAATNLAWILAERARDAVSLQEKSLLVIFLPLMREVTGVLFFSPFFEAEFSSLDSSSWRALLERLDGCLTDDGRELDPEWYLLDLFPRLVGVGLLSGSLSRCCLGCLLALSFDNAPKHVLDTPWQQVGLFFGSNDSELESLAGNLASSELLLVSEHSLLFERLTQIVRIMQGKSSFLTWSAIAAADYYQMLLLHSFQ